MSTEQAATPAAEVPAGTAAIPAPETQAPEAPKPEKNFTQKELDEILEKRLSKERRKREEKDEEIRVLRKLALERGNQPPPVQQPAKAAPADDKEPTRGDYESYDEFVTARAEYRAGKTAEGILAKRDKDDAEKAAQETSRKASESFKTRLKESAKGIEDFDTVFADAVHGPVGKLDGPAIADCDSPAKVLYHLATHPDEAERIASLPSGQQAREIWKLDTALAADKPPAKQPSKAPAPIAPVVGGSTATAEEMPDPSKDQAAWFRWRNAQIRAKRTPGKAA